MTSNSAGDGAGTGPALDAEVVVVGAGPVGLLLAGELRLGGVDVVVLEERATPVEESRASTLHARTMEILDSRGLLERFGELPNQPSGHFGGIPLDLTLPGTPYPGQWKVEQPRTEKLLQEWATSLGARVRRGHTVRGLTDEGDHVVAEAEGPAGPVRLRAAYVVGCDGEHSTVRQSSGIALRGTEARHELLRADVEGIRIPDRRFERHEGGLAIAARRDGTTRVMAHAYGMPPRERGGKAPEFAEVAEVWRTVTGEDISDGTPVWTNAFGDVDMQADSYRTGRVLLAGDAAHQQLPAGGQALNLGLQDAFNLGWKLALAVRDLAPDSLLDTYHAERHAAGRRILDNIRTQAMLLLGGSETDGPRAVMTELIAQEAGVRRRFAGVISGLGVHYEVGDGDIHTSEAAHPQPGAPFPVLSLSTTDGGRTTSAALLREGRGLLLSLDAGAAGAAGAAGSAGEQAEAAAAAAGPWEGRITYVSAVPDPVASDPVAPDPVAPGSCRAPGDGQPAVHGALFLVRPDGHVAWAGSGGGTDGLTEALHRWFGPPGTP